MSRWLHGDGPAPWASQYVAPRQFDTSREPAARGYFWTNDCPDGANLCPPHLPRRYWRQSDIVYCYEEPHLGFYQSKPVSLQHDLSAPVARPPDFERVNRGGLPEGHIKLLYGTGGWPLAPPHMPEAWMPPYFAPVPTDNLGFVSDCELTLIIWDILLAANINPYYLLHYFCLIPDPEGCGPLTFTHPIMRRVAAIAYCLHFPSMHGLVYDVARECGRARAQQAEPYYTTYGSNELQAAKLRSLSHELWALAFNAEPRFALSDYFFAYGVRHASRLAVRLQLGHAWACHIMDPEVPLGAFDWGFPEAGVENPEGAAMCRPLTVPWEARTAYMGWSDRPDCMGIGTPPQILAERTVWTTKAVDRLLEWAHDRPGPILAAHPGSAAPNVPRSPGSPS